MADTIVGFVDGLYKATCADCGEKLYWEADFDADGTNYHATCCDHRYTMYPHTVRIHREEDE
jgi:hypothetical protein